MQRCYLQSFEQTVREFTMNRARRVNLFRFTPKILQLILRQTQLVLHKELAMFKQAVLSPFSPDSLSNDEGTFRLIRNHLSDKEEISTYHMPS